MDNTKETHGVIYRIWNRKKMKEAIQMQELSDLLDLGTDSIKKEEAKEYLCLKYEFSITPIDRQYRDNKAQVYSQSLGFDRSKDPLFSSLVLPEKMKINSLYGKRLFIKKETARVFGFTKKDLIDLITEKTMTYNMSLNQYSVTLPTLQLKVSISFSGTERGEVEWTNICWERLHKEDGEYIHSSWG